MTFGATTGDIAPNRFRHSLNLPKIFRQFPVDFGIAFDDTGEGLTFDQSLELFRQMILIPEAITVAEASELIDENRVDRRSYHSATNRRLSESPDPDVHPFNIPVDLFEFFLKVFVRGDFVEVAQGFESVGFANHIETGESVISASLNVEGREVEATGTGGTEEEVANVIDEQGVDFLSRLMGQSTQEWLNSALVDDFGRIEKRRREIEVAFVDLIEATIEAFQLAR